MEKHCPILALLILISSAQLLSQSPDWLWANSFGGSSYDGSRGIALDNTGNCYTVGFFQSPSITFGTTTLTNSSGFPDIFIVKCDANGNPVWAKKAGGSNSDSAYSVIVGNSGNIYVTGFFKSPSITFGSITLSNSGGDDLFVAKLDSLGNFIWAIKAGGTNNDRAFSIASDQYENIFITGNFASPSINFGATTLNNSGNTDIYLAKFDSSGNATFAKKAGGSEYDEAYSVATDAAGNCFIAGMFGSSTINFATITLTNSNSVFHDMFISKFDNSGNIIWAKNTGGNDNEQANCVITDVMGNCYVTGTFASSLINFGTITLSNTGQTDIYFVKYDLNGNILWAKSTEGIDSESPTCIYLDSNGHSYLTGSFNSHYFIVAADTLINISVTDTMDIFLVKYDLNGNSIWSLSVGSNMNDVATTITGDNSGNIILSGYSFSPVISFGNTNLNNNGNNDVFIAKLDSTTITATRENKNLNNQISLFPNPAASSFTLSLPTSNKRYEVTITDLDGKIFYTSTSTETQKVEVNTKDFAAGVYFVQIKSTELFKSEKLIIQK